MYCVQNITEDLYWVGGSDRRITLFENVFPSPNGMAYNSYLLKDEVNVIIDTIDTALSEQFIENVEYLLDGEELHYVVITHMEPDHSATLRELIIRYPKLKIVANAKIKKMLNQFFEVEDDLDVILMNDGDKFCFGKHEFRFIAAPMVHWPEVMMAYDEHDKVLFSADAFGTFGALSGNIFADEINFERKLLDEARRYYSNIVGQYGAQVQNLLKKIAKLNVEIKYLCPLHGLIWRDDIDWYIDKYDKWSRLEPEDDAVVIIYSSVYGHTENAMNILATELAKKGVKNIKMYDVSSIDSSYILSQAYRCSHIVFAATTYNNHIFSKMDTVLRDMKNHGLQNRQVAVLENGSWAPSSGKQMIKILESMPNMEIISPMITLLSAVKDKELVQIEEMAETIYQSLDLDEELAAEMCKLTKRPENKRKKKKAGKKEVKEETSAEPTVSYVCKVCGYVHEGEMPDDFICPICGKDASFFEKNEVAEEAKEEAKKEEKSEEPKVSYVCKVCGYIHEGEMPDDFICPICGKDKSFFERVEN